MTVGSERATGSLYDAIVIGAGLAGLTAALRLAEAGKSVVVAAKGVGAVQLAAGTIDVLGYDPQRVPRPAEALERLRAARPDHPYAKLPPGSVRAAVEWFVDRMRRLDYVGGVDDNMLLPTAVGTLKPSAAAPRSIAAGDVRGGGRYVIAGLRALKDFFPAYLASNLGRNDGVMARAVDVEVETNEADVTPVGFAQRFDDPGWRRAVIAALGPRIEPGEAVGFPAVVGLDDPEAAVRELQEGLDAPVFEIPTLPPSVPGIRLFRALKGAIRAHGGRVVLGSWITGAVTDEARVEAVVAEAAARPTTYRARHFVLASGGFASGGIAMDSRWRVAESIFGLPVSGVPPAGHPRLAEGVFDDHPIARAGVAVDDRLRPVGGDGEPVFDNVHAVGATLTGAEPWREKSGDGISVATGHFAAGCILGERG
jgi:glycerol-3-phosphate dehydrogenase subunit B